MWRDPHTVQLGTDPAQAVVLELPHPAAARLLDLLDGSHTDRAICAEMARIGMPETDVQIVLNALVEAGLVVAAHSLLPSALPAEHRHRVAAEAAALALRFRDRSASPAAILRRRYRSRVIIAGAGPFPPLLISALLHAGVGTVGQVTEPGAAAISVDPTPFTTPAGQHSPAQRGAGQDSATQGGAGKSSGQGGRAGTVRGDDAFVVQIGPMGRVAVRGSRRRRPLLAIGVRDGVAIVGPLVPVAGGPCLRCLDLHRTDRDPAWPRLAAQLAEQDTDPVPCAAATILSAAGLAAAEILTYLDGGEPSTIGSTIEINGGGPWRRRSWAPHASCDCTSRK
ncbi:thiamin biosynthesis protein [Rhizocola hellebori]|uniref:Thiamin biosynthesis protein n=1 Tax=Rhizocola hellebori TaxID=1392758 RepID=A0A8J3QF25_9ACTN|nr:thiamin biosynthesis protein [Rhizocola hellebori]